ncbi:hypothetical protein L6452_26343 [Arctium lappa]|uniref:Uncharacterized protein n=1 Tax=Arctium lappa TaxID=4217 RepID=A0ACB9ABU8_ARCLA|nr:hypothetical protein L6452_26343 [Arctium lappa]
MISTVAKPESIGVVVVLINMQYLPLPHFTSLVTLPSSKQTKQSLYSSILVVYTQSLPMAFELKSPSLSLLLLLCLLLLLQHSDGLNDAEKTHSSVASLKEIRNRKLLMVNALEAKEGVFKIQGNNMESKEEGWELRAAPLGPDPLHHHGADPKKPRTP